MELSALLAESGHRVRLWEAQDRLGGALHYATLAPRHEMYAAYLDWQVARLATAGVEVSLGHRATADDVLAAGADTVAVATGATPRRPGIVGDDLPHVLDVRDVLAERAIPGRRVLVVSQDDHVAPLSVADFLSGRGHEVTVVFATATPAPSLGRYIVGAILGRLDEQGVELRSMEEVTAIEPGRVHTRNVYSLRPRVIEGIDSVVLACGSVSDSTLFDDLAGRHTDLHILGDAYAPRRLVFATKQAYALADLIARRPTA